MLFKKKRFCAVIFILLLLSPRNTNSIGFLVALLPYYPYLIPVAVTVVGLFKINNDKKMRDLQNGVDEVRRETREINVKVTVVDNKVTVIDEKVEAVHGTVNNFDKKTDKNFIEVKSEVLATKVTLMKELSNKEKILSDLIKTTEQNVRQELQENYKSLDLSINSIKQDITTLATKEDLSDLKKTAKLIEDKLNNLRNEIGVIIKESELRIKEDLKNKLEISCDKVVNDIDPKLVLLRQYLERVERKQTEFGNNFMDLDNKVTKIGSDVGEVKKIIVEKTQGAVV
jgi:predicted  nucleic acid-binding Zn-ribbon protein